MNDYYNHEHYPDPTPYEALKEIRKEQSGRRYMPLVFICSPFSEDTGKNINAARRYCRFAVDRGYIPVAPHLIYPQFLDDAKADERQLGMFFGKVLMTKCTEVWVFGECISAGMQEEIQYAEKRRLKVRYFTDDYKEVER